MNIRVMNTAVKWAAQIAHVREVSLLSTADLAYWEERLLGENLLAAQCDGQAQILMIATDSKYMGVRFRELSFSVLVSWLEAGIPQDSAYLVRAFNSFRFFAFCERVLFSTPYDHGDVRVSASFPPSIRLLKKGKVRFRAEMRADGSGSDREPSRVGRTAGKGRSSCLKTSVEQAARASGSLRGSAARPGPIRSFLPRTRSRSRDRPKATFLRRSEIPASSQKSGSSARMPRTRNLRPTRDPRCLQVRPVQTPSSQALHLRLVTRRRFSSSKRREMTRQRSLIAARFVHIDRAATKFIARVSGCFRLRCCRN